MKTLKMPKCPLVNLGNSHTTKYKKNGHIKITANDVMDIEYFKIPGCISIDTRIVYRKLFPKEKSSLKSFLIKMKLEEKIDLSPITLHTYYKNIINKISNENESKDNMYKIIEYCFRDATSCQALMIKQDVISNYKQISKISYISLSDPFYYAGGIRVCNLLGLFANDMDILITMVKSNEIEEGKFPGAYVYPPIKKLHNDNPVGAIDFESLYPSIIITYNLSPEKIIFTHDEYNRLKNNGFELHNINFMFNNRMINAWSVNHKNNENDMGLYPRVLKYLLNERKKQKNKLKILKEKKEKMESMTSFDRDEYDQLCFDYSFIDLIQLSLKIYANSFYGETGNPLSSLFMRELG